MTFPITPAAMTTKLEKPIKREITVGGRAFTVTLSPDGLRLSEKGKRSGQSFNWEDLLSGSVALKRDLEGSLAGNSRAGTDDSAMREPEEL
jgi:hypothetical protein